MLKVGCGDCANAPTGLEKSLIKNLAWPLLALAVALLSACAPGVRPPVFVPRDQVPLAGLPTVMAGWPAPDWWTRYDDPQLDRLMQMAMRDSPDVQVAEARYRAALRAVASQRAGLSPTLTGNALASHGYSNVQVNPDVAGGQGSAQSIPLKPGSSSSNTGLFYARLNWDLDLWGKQKAAIAAAVGRARARRAGRAAAASSLQYNLANTYFDWQAQQARLQVARQSIRTALKYRDLVVLRVNAGLDDPDTRSAADLQLAQQRRGAAVLTGASALDQAQLAAIVGVSPSALPRLKPRPLPSIDTKLPSSARLGLIARRPDIVAARWQIEASLRNIDQARAAFYPDVSLTGLGAFLRTSPNLGTGTRTGLTVADIGPSVSLPIFSGGRLQAQFDISQAQLDSVVASYNRTVVQAAQDVATGVLTLQQLDAVNQQQQLQLDASRSMLRSAKDRRGQGVTDDRPYLNAQMQLDRQRDGLLQVQAQTVAANLALIRALGGGYHTGQLPPLPPTKPKDSAL